MQKEKYLEIIDALLEEAEEVENSQFRPRIAGAQSHVNQQLLHRWWGKVKSLYFQLGSAAEPWRETLSTDPEKNTLVHFHKVLGVLEAVRYEIEHDHLDSYTQIIRAETLTDLLEQAEHLLEKGYFLAAGVIGRAVLEEHLRNICEILGCMPEKAKPTLSDFNSELYKVKHYPKTRMKHIDTLASIGNDAAHNKPELKVGDVEMFIRDLPGILDSTGT